MNDYVPFAALSVWRPAALLLGVLMAAFAISQMTPGRRSRSAAWLLVISATWGMERVTAHEPPILRMAAIILALLWSFKAVVCVEEQIAGKPRLSPLEWWIFAAAWLGMRPTEFLLVFSKPRQAWQELMLRGARR